MHSGGDHRSHPSLKDYGQLRSTEGEGGTVAYRLHMIHAHASHIVKFKIGKETVKLGVGLLR